MSSTSQKIYSGRCLCGLVQYEVTGEPEIVAHCHCKKCQRLTGSGHSTGAMFPVDQFKMIGEVGEYQYISDNGNEVSRAFCPSCGSPIFSRNSTLKGFLTISLGTFDDSSDFTPSVVIFARNRNSWDFMDEGLSTFDEQPLWKPSNVDGKSVKK